MGDGILHIGAAVFGIIAFSSGSPKHSKILKYLLIILMVAELIAFIWALTVTKRFTLEIIIFSCISLKVYILYKNH